MFMEVVQYIINEIHYSVPPQFSDIDWLIDWLLFYVQGSVVHLYDRTKDRWDNRTGAKNFDCYWKSV